LERTRYGCRNVAKARRAKGRARHQGIPAEKGRGRKESVTERQKVWGREKKKGSALKRTAIPRGLKAEIGNGVLKGRRRQKRGLGNGRSKAHEGGAKTRLGTSKEGKIMGDSEKNGTQHSVLDRSAPIEDLERSMEKKSTKRGGKYTQSGGAQNRYLHQEKKS